MSKGVLVVFSGPSGCGKDTILHHYLGGREDVFLSISATTRSPRPGEVDGVSYFVLSEEQFKEKIAHDGMLEYACYCGNYYGTPRDIVYEKLNAGIDVILEIEVQGALQIKKRCPEAVMIFVMPPSMEELRSRLVGRGTEDMETVEKRLLQAQEEMKAAPQYDFIIVNDLIEQAAADLQAVLRSQRLKTENQKEFLNEVFHYDA